MRIAPRQQLLEIWKATARTSYADGTWKWGGREDPNSITDAEQLLCLLLPASGLEDFRLHRPDQTRNDVRAALRGFGDAFAVPRLLVSQLAEFLRIYTAPDGTPIFSGGSAFSAASTDTSPTDAQRELDVVESYAVSILLTLSALSFVRGFRNEISRRDILAEIADVEAAASIRLSAAIVGLLRSFSVNVFHVESRFGRSLLRTIDQAETGSQFDTVDDRLVAELRQQLAPILAGLRGVTIGSGQMQPDESDLREPNFLFEIGWSWGIVENAPAIEFVTEYPEGTIGRQGEGYALDAPYLYFSVVALDAMAELFSEKTRREGLLNDLQLRLAQALQIRYDLTQRYWATIASFGDDRWPLQDIPWRTTDGQESDYFTLMVSSIAARQLAQADDPEAGLSKLVLVLAELANRGRLTRRPVIDDPAIALHHPGLEMKLDSPGQTNGPPLAWVATDFAPLLMKRAVRTGRLIKNINLREQALSIADQAWDHVRQRRIAAGVNADLWDQPANAFPDHIKHRHEAASWHHTLRVVESLVLAADLVTSHPLRSEQLYILAQNLLGEAEHLFDQELLATDQLTHGGDSRTASDRTQLAIMRNQLIRARGIIADRPGSAAAIVHAVLVELNRLAEIRLDGSEAW